MLAGKRRKVNCFIKEQSSLFFAVPACPVTKRLLCKPELRAASVLAWKRSQLFSPAATKRIQFVKCFLGMSKP